MCWVSLLKIWLLPSYNYTRFLFPLCAGYSVVERSKINKLITGAYVVYGLFPHLYDIPLRGLEWLVNRQFEWSVSRWVTMIGVHSVPITPSVSSIDINKGASPSVCAGR